MPDIVAPYQSALIALALLTVGVLAQGFYTIWRHLQRGGGTPGEPPTGGYDNPVWRVWRAHANSLENFAPFAIALLLAVLCGASAPWVNALAWAHVAARLAHWLIYVRAIGPHAAGPRTIAFVAAFSTQMALALLALRAAFG